MALSWLGANPILSFDDEIIEAQLCKENYEPCRDAVLAEADWSFAIREAELNKLTYESIIGASSYFQLPPNCLRVIEAYDGGDNPLQYWEVSALTVRAKTDTVKIRYIAQVEYSEMFSSTFVQALAARIAATLAIPITQNKSVMDAMWQLYAQLLRVATSTDGLQGGDRPLGRSYLLEARYKNA